MTPEQIAQEQQEARDRSAAWRRDHAEPAMERRRRLNGSQTIASKLLDD